MARRMVDIFARLLADDTGFEADVVRKAQKAGDAAGKTLGAQLATGLASGAGQLSKTLGSMGKELTRTGRAMTTNLTLPILAAGGAVTHFALDFDTTLRRIVGLTDVTAGEIDGIREKLLKMGPAIGVGPDKLAEAFYFVASAGFKSDEAMKVLEVSAKASAAGMGETATIAQVLGAAINAYGHENLTAARAGDILTAAVKDGSVEASAFAAVIGRVVPIAASLGVSFDQVTAALAGMTLSGVDADEAATSLRQIMVSLLKPSAEANTAIEAMGLSAAGLRAELREKGLLATLRTLDEAFGTNADATAKVFGNVRALAGIQNLLGLSSEQLNTIFGDTAAELDQLNGAYKDTAGPQRDVDKAMSELQSTAIGLGADVLPVVVDVLKQIAAGAKELAAWWKSLDKGTRAQIVQWLAWLAVLGPAIVLLGKLSTGLSAIFRVVQILAGAKGIPRLIGWLWKMKLAGLGALGVVAGLALLGKGELDAIGRMGRVAQRGQKLGISWDDLRKKAEKLVETTGVELPDALDTVLTAMEDADKAAGRIGEGGIFGLAMRTLQEQMAAAKKGAGDLPTSISASLKDGRFVVERGIEQALSPIDEALQKAVEATAKRAQEIIDALASKLADAPSQIKDELKALREALLHPYTDVARRADLESALASTVIIRNLRSGDSKIAAEAATQVETWLAEYELLAPGALAAGALVNPALQAGIAKNLDALLVWIRDNTGLQITNAYDFADVLQTMGYDSLAAYVRGMEDARIGKLAHELYMGNVDVHTGLPDDLYDEGYGAGKTYGEGFHDAGIIEVIPAVQRFAGKIANLLKFAGSPDYSHSREYGGKVIRSWLDQAMATARAGIPGLASALAGGLSGMSFAPGLAAAGVPTQIPAGMGGAAPAQAGPGSVVNNTWRLDVNGVPYTFKSRADFIKALDAVSRFGGSDGRLPSE